MIMRTDLYQGHDYYNMDDLLTEEHKLIRDTARAWVKQEVSPIIEDAAENCIFPQHLLPGLGEIGKSRSREISIWPGLSSSNTQIASLPLFFSVLAAVDSCLNFRRSSLST